MESEPTGWAQVARVRNDFADLIEGLDDAQLSAPTWCQGWTPREVLGHLVTFVDLSLPKFMLSVAKARGDFDPAADAMARAQAERPVADMIASLRTKAGQKGKMPGFPAELSVVDAMAHTQDIRRPLGLDGSLREHDLRTALDFLATNKKSKILLEHKDLLQGIRLEATDMDWSAGTGATISGTAEALMLGLLRRPVTDELSGDGVDTLRTRQAS